MKWITKDGVEIHVKKLEDKHLINIYNMIWRNASYYRKTALKALVGANNIIKSPTVSKIISKQIEEIENLDNEKMLNKVLKPYLAIKAEMRKRKLYTNNKHNAVY